MTAVNKENDRLYEMIEMIGSMASLDFSKRLDVEVNEEPINVIAYGLNMLGEELEANMVKRTLLEEINANLERFSYTVAHDIRAPFNSALAVISLIEMELEEHNNEALKEHLLLLGKLHMRISQTINDILEYSRTNFSKLKLIDIDIKEVFNEIAEEYKLAHELTVSYMPDMPRIRYNETALRQVFSNLIGNAIKYNDKAVCELSLECVDAGAYFEISVKDNGPGIEEERLDRIFDLFENFSSERTNSYGIGLSIVKKIITSSGGVVWARSVIGQGSKFVFTIKK